MYSCTKTRKKTDEQAQGVRISYTLRLNLTPYPSPEIL